MNNLASFIDHTALKPDNTIKDINRLCDECIEFGFASACVPLNFVPYTYQKLKNAMPLVCTVVGFPLGFTSTSSKCFETQYAIDNGADEIDMVIAINQLKSGNWRDVEYDIAEVLKVTKANNKLLKVIIETALLSDDEKIKICNICAQLNVDFVKTSTGFSKSGATVADIKLMRNILPNHIQIKASGGIGNGNFAKELINAGATRLGCSRSVSVINS